MWTWRSFQTWTPAMEERSKFITWLAVLAPDARSGPRVVLGLRALPASYSLHVQRSPKRSACSDSNTPMVLPWQRCQGTPHLSTSPSAWGSKWVAGCLRGHSAVIFCRHLPDIYDKHQSFSPGVADRLWECPPAIHEAHADGATRMVGWRGTGSRCRQTREPTSAGQDDVEFLLCSWW